MHRCRPRVAIGLVAVALAAASIGLTATAARASPAGPNIWIALYSTPGDFMAPPGKSQLFTPTDTLQLYSGGSSGEVYFRVRGSDDYDFLFAAPQGQTLAPGYYGHADRLEFRRTGHAGIDISGDAKGCNVDNGDFVIEDIAYLNGAVTRLAMTFIQHCEGGTGAIFGETRYNEPTTGPLSAQATSLRLPPQYVGVGVDLPLWVTNTGVTAIPVGPAAISGTGAGDVAISADTCPPSLAPDATCVITVTVTPRSAGPAQSTITIPEGTSTLTVPVDDSGIAGNAAFSIDSEPGETVGAGQFLTLNQFNSTVSGLDLYPSEPGAPTTVEMTATTVDGGHSLIATLAAPTGHTLTIGTYANTLPSATSSRPGLSITADRRTCTDGTGAASGSGQFTVREIGFDADGIITHFAADAKFRCALGGPALFTSLRAASTFGYAAANFQPTPAKQIFALQLIGTTSAAQQIDVTNTGSLSQTISPTIVGQNPADFRLTTTCGAHGALLPGGSCSLSVAFAPVAAGNRSASLVITDGTTRGVRTSELSGYGATAPWLTYPVDGQNNVYTSNPFTWVTLPGAQANMLVVGTNSVSDDVVNSGVLPGNQMSYQVSNLPSDRGLYATVFSEFGGHWYHSPTIGFLLTPQVAHFTSPLDGSGFNQHPVFTWFNNIHAGGYYLIVGTSPGSANLVDSGVLPASAFSYYPPPLPKDTVLYATIYTEWAGRWDSHQSISFLFKAGATFISPTNGQQTVSPAAPYTWFPYPNAQGYYLVVSTTPGGSNLINSGVLQSSQSSYPGVPLPKGVTLYATVFTEIAGSWSHYQTITLESH